MPLYHVQDDCRPMYVIADDWQDALTKWKRVIEIENPLGARWENPRGIIHICSDDDLIAD